MTDFRAAIAAVRPELADTPFVLHSAGWDCTAVEAGATIFKFPKHAEAVPRLRKEAGLLALIRPRVPLTVPDMRLHESPLLFSEHPKIPGALLETADYARLHDAQRDALADALAGFYAALHSIPVEAAIAAGATPVPEWPGADQVMAKVEAMLPAAVHAEARRILAAYAVLPAAEPSLCYLDGHGWNMAFDHAGGTLTGLYDFADAGLSPRTRDLSYSDFISPDLTEQLVAAYERAAGRSVDRREVALHTAVQRLAELGGSGRPPDWFIANALDWLAHMRADPSLAV